MLRYSNNSRRNFDAWIYTINMSTPATLDFDALLAPISESAPSGVSLREHPDLSRTYYAVREARNLAMEAERALARLALMEQRDFDSDLSGQEEPRPVPNWAKVADMASDVLCHHSKDLWAMSWLIEAITRLEGIAGFRDGIQLCREMSQKFWETIYPRPDDEEGYGHTVAQLAGLDNTLSPALEAAPMLASDPRITWVNYQNALDLDQMEPERRAERLEAGGLSMSSFQHVIRQADQQELATTHADLTEAIAQLREFSSVMDELCGKDDSGYPLSPPTANLLRTLERQLQIFDSLTAGILGETEGTAASEVAEVVTGELTDTVRPTGGEANFMQRPVASREEALQHLLRVADYFRKAEPHSPVSYALEQAVRWGRMPLPDLLKDLVSDTSVLAEVFKRMGIATPEESSE